MKSKLQAKQAQLKEVLDKWVNDMDLESIADLPQYEEILRAQCAEITKKIVIDKEWTSVQVVKVYCHKALKVHLKLNCLTEIMFDRAIKKAEQLDAKFAVTGIARGKLHGVPISVKDHVDVAGYDATSGYSGFALKPFDEDSVIIQILEEQGGIPFVKTNVCQFMMTFESSNPVFGRTLNPYNHAYVSGGSSSGEGALIGAGGSCLGVGGDIAGSLRIPALFCGIYTLKPSYGRLPLSGNTHTGIDGAHEILPTMGPMARSVEDLELFMEALNGKDGLYARDPLTVFYNKPYTKVDFGDKKLRIGYYTQNGVLTVSPACVRATTIVIDALKDLGHELVPIEIPDSFEICKKFYRWAAADGSKCYFKSLGSDSIENGIKLIIYSFKLPFFLKSTIAFFLKLAGEQRAAELITSMGEVTVQQLYQLHHELLMYRKKFFAYWKSLEIDFAVGPGFPFPALPHESFSDTSLAGWHTAMFNMVNFSVGALPVTTVDKELDKLNLTDTSKFDLVEKIAYRYYDAASMHGLPVGVQIIGGYREDEKTLAAMKVVDSAIKGL